MPVTATGPVLRQEEVRGFRSGHGQPARAQPGGWGCSSVREDLPGRDKPRDQVVNGEMNK